MYINSRNNAQEFLKEHKINFCKNQNLIFKQLFYTLLEKSSPQSTGELHIKFEPHYAYLHRKGKGGCQILILMLKMLRVPLRGYGTNKIDCTAWLLKIEQKQCAVHAQQTPYMKPTLLIARTHKKTSNFETEI